MDQPIAEAAVQAAVDPGTRALFLGLLVGAPLLGLVPTSLSWLQLSRFLRRVPALATEQDLARFKSVARWQMYGALLQLAVLFSPWALFFLGLARGALGVYDSVFSTGAFIVVGVAGYLLRTLEKRVQTLPCASIELAAARDAVVQAWLKKPLPDWD